MALDDPSRRWLLLVHQLPSQSSNLRVKVWRRLQRVGAVLLKSSVYVLPSSSETHEDLQWIRGEIIAQGGEAVIFAADAVDDLATDEVVDAFVTARQSDWDELHRRATALHQRHDSTADDEESSREQLERELKSLRHQTAQIDKIDYFQAPGRQEALAAIVAAAQAIRPEPPEPPLAGPTLAADDFRGRRWLTRPRPGVDRMASAWLIRRYLDPDAEFSFAEQVPPEGDPIPFDMFGVEFGHHGQHCTFETLLQAFALDEPPLARIARIVHDLDLRSFISFGGPAGQIAIMHRELVERRRWISEDRFLHALNYCMLLPGPEAQQLAIYIGWLLHRVRGGIVAGGLFVLPSIFVLLGLSWAYAAHGETPAVAGVLYGFRPVVVAIVCEAVVRIGRRAIRKRAHLGIAAAAFIAIYLLGVPFPLIVVAAALVGWLGSRLLPGVFTTPARAAKPASHDGKPEDLPLVIDDDSPPAPHTLPSLPKFLRALSVGVGLWLWGA